MLNEVLKSIIIEQATYIIYPSDGNTIEEQLDSCISQISVLFQKTGFHKWQIIKQVCFINCYNNEDKKVIDKTITVRLNSFYSFFIPTSIVPEPPVNGYKVAIEITIMPSLESGQIEIKEIKNTKYTTVKTNQGTYVIGCGLGILIDNSVIYNQGHAAFEQLQQILDNEHITFGNIIRQWNYVEEIVGYTGTDQHYQIFNDIRSSYYCKSDFSNGYPSATGIGMSCGGLIIDFIALVPASGTKIIPLKSPVQADAHQYSKNVLAPNTQSADKTKTTPKFERAKIVMNDEFGTVYVSGTAAIKGELSANQFEIEQQTSLTINNIFQLVSNENLAKHGISQTYKADPQYFRVYVKKRSDFSIVQEIVTKNIGKTPVVYIEADICRPELVIEIEGIFTLSSI